MLREYENPQGGSSAGGELPDGNAELRAKKIMMHAVNEAMKPALDSLGTGGCDELIAALEKEIVRSASFYAIYLADALKKVHTSLG